jgi:hypothetical protein
MVQKQADVKMSSDEILKFLLENGTVNEDIFQAVFFASTFCKKLHRAFPKVAWGNSLLLHPL